MSLESATQEPAPISSIQVVKEIEGEWQKRHDIASAAGMDDIADVAGQKRNGEVTGLPYKLERFKDSGNYANLYRLKPGRLFSRALFGRSYELIASNSQDIDMVSFTDPSASADDEYGGAQNITVGEYALTLYTDDGKTALSRTLLQQVNNDDEPKNVMQAKYKVRIITDRDGKNAKTSEVDIDADTGEQLSADVKHTADEQRKILAKFGINLNS